MNLLIFHEFLQISNSSLDLAVSLQERVETNKCWNETLKILMKVFLGGTLTWVYFLQKAPAGGGEVKDPNEES